MKYGVLFTLMAIFMLATAIVQGGWYLLLIWPAVAFFGVGLAYFLRKPSIYRKSADGVLPGDTCALFAPMLFLLQIVWHLVRLVSREPPHQQIHDRIIIGRRLLSHELPDEVDAVIDLTSEFTEPRALRQRGYHSFPILDADVPSDVELLAWLRKTDDVQGTLYIHCAQGHGRTALFTACLLLHRGVVATADEALGLVQSHRPLARLNRKQSQFLKEISPRIVRDPRTIS